MVRYPRRDWLAVAAAVLAPFAASAALVPFRDVLTAATHVLVLVAVVVAVAAFGNRVAGALSALSAAAWFDFFLTQPYQTFTIDKPDDIQAALLMLLVGLVVSQLAARVRRLRVITVTDAGHLAAIHDAAELARSKRSPSGVIENVRKRLTDVLNLRECRFEHGSLLGNKPRLMPDGTVLASRGRWAAEESLPDDEIELRVYGSGRFYGRFVMRANPGAAPSLQSRLVAITLADVVGAALHTANTATVR